MVNGFQSAPFQPIPGFNPLSPFQAQAGLATPGGASAFTASPNGGVSLTNVVTADSFASPEAAAASQAYAFGGFRFQGFPGFRPFRPFRPILNNSGYGAPQPTYPPAPQPYQPPPYQPQPYQPQSYQQPAPYQPTSYQQPSYSPPSTQYGGSVGSQPVANTQSTGGQSAPIQANGSGPSIVVIDQTSASSSGIDLDGDGVRDRSHGEVVNDFIRSQIPNANISNVEIPNYEPATLTGLFNSVSAQVDQGQRVDAVNFSQQTFNSIRELAQVTGLPLNNDNLAQFKPQIKATLRQYAQNPAAAPAGAERFTQWLSTIDAMEGLASRGVPVYVAAGNDGPDQINMFALADGAVVVGARDANGNRTSYTADNSLVTRAAVGDNAITPLVNGQGAFVGVDYTGDRIVNAGVSQLTTGGPPRDPNRQVTGTSFAAPKILANDMITKFGLLA